MDHKSIMAEYRQLERAARAMIPGKFLMPDDVLTCCDVCARRLGVTVDDVKDAIRADASGMWG